MKFLFSIFFVLLSQSIFARPSLSPQSLQCGKYFVETAVLNFNGYWVFNVTIKSDDVEVFGFPNIWTKEGVETYQINADQSYNLVYHVETKKFFLNDEPCKKQ